MTTGPAEPSVAVLDAVLLEAKLLVPPLPSSSVSRAHLIRSARSTGCRVAGVTAPAGYGKSTLLAEWASMEDRRIAWVALDRWDDDPATLLSTLAAACADLSGHPDLVANARLVGMSALSRAAPLIAAALQNAPRPFVLFLDDVHQLTSLACQDVLDVVIAGIPHGSQLVAASRAAQPYLPRLRASGDAVEITAPDLALDTTGTAQVFAQAGVPIADEIAETLTAKTEGWPAGLHLAALIARAGGTDILSITGDDRFVADYLYQQSLAQLPEAVQTFLRRTSVLDQLSADLCDALLGATGSDQQLRELEARSLFLIPLDRRRGWYRYHALFREFLASEQRRVEPDAIAKLHLRAADWYETNKLPALAVEHLLHTSEHERCTQLVAKLILPTFQAGQMPIIRRWLTTLGDAAIRKYPPVAVLAGWTAATSGDFIEAQRWAAFAETATFDPVPVDGTASFVSGRAILRALMCPAGPKQMIIDARTATAAEPAWSGWRATAVGLAAEAHLLAGDHDRATALFNEACATASTLGNVHVLVTGKAELAILAMDHGRWNEAARHLAVALATVDSLRLHDHATTVLALAAGVRLAIHRGNKQAADHELAQAMRARPTCTAAVPWLAVRVRLQLAKAYASRGNHTPAQHLIREIDEVLLQRPHLGTLIDEVAAVRTTLVVTTKSPGGQVLTASELRLLPYLQTHLTYTEIGQRLFLSRNTIATHVSSIYRKLGVSSRSHAVESATTIGLLGS